MGPSGSLARAWLRRNITATVLLTLLVALVVGAAGGAFAGGRRASSSLDRFLAYNRPPDAQVYTPDGSSFDVGAVTALPQVAGWSTGAYGLLTAEGPGGGPFPSGDVNPFIPIAVDGDRSYRPFVVDGRLPDDGDPHELALDEEAARRLGAAVGDAVELRLYTPSQMESFFDGGDFPQPDGATVATEVTAIVRHAFDVTPSRPEDIDAVQLASSEVYPSLAFWDRYGDGMAAYGDGTDNVEVVLSGGAGAVHEFEEAIRALPGGDSLVVDVSNDALVAVDDARQAVRFEAFAALLFGALVLVVGVVLAGQAIARQVRAELDQGAVLRGIGLTRGDIARAATLRMSAVVLGGSALGVGLAYLSSARMPFGTAAKAEIEPGLRLDLLPLAGAAAVVAVSLLLWSARASWHAEGRPTPVRGGWAERLAAAAATAGAPVSVVFGLSQLGRARVGPPVRSSMSGVTFAVAAVVAVLVYGATTTRFVEEPDQHGWAWDLLVGDSDDEKLVESGAERLEETDGVVGFASLWTGWEDTVSTSADRQVVITAVERGAGDTYIQLADGRSADRVDEVVLGRQTMEELDVSLGGRVLLEGPGGGGDYRVVGVAVLHQVVSDGFELDEGAVTSREGLARLFGDDIVLDRFLVDVDPGADLPSTMSSLREDFGPTVTPHVPPLDVASLQGTQQLPVLLGLVVAMIGAGSLVHLLLVVVRRRRIEFAVLRSLGATPGQVSSAVATVASAAGAIAVCIGVPAGVVGGRVAWTALAGSVGAPTAPVVPISAVLVGTVAVVVLANVIAAVPGRLVRRTAPAEILRSE